MNPIVRWAISIAFGVVAGLAIGIIALAEWQNSEWTSYSGGLFIALLTLIFCVLQGSAGAALAGVPSLIIESRDTREVSRTRCLIVSILARALTTAVVAVGLVVINGGVWSSLFALSVSIWFAIMTTLTLVALRDRP